MGVRTKVHDVCPIFGIINYFRVMWHKRAYAIDTLTKSCSTKFKFKCTDVEHNAFMERNKIVSRDALLSYPKFS